MGNRKRAPDRGRPKTVIAGGQRAGGAGIAAVEAAEGLDVPLMHLDLSVIEQSAVGAPVRLEDDSHEISAWTASGHLGDVRPHYRRAVREAGATRAVVILLTRDPPNAVIRIR